MSKFKFGDRVSCSYLEENETAIVISHQPQSGSCYVITPDKESFWVDDKALTLIPHPDTARLDYIEEVLASIDYVVHYDTHTKQNTFCRVKPYVGSKYYEGRSVRKAIDNAMRQEQTP